MPSIPGKNPIHIVSLSLSFSPFFFPVVISLIDVSLSLSFDVEIFFCNRVQE
jgi:hypothetical protein